MSVRQSRRYLFPGAGKIAHIRVRHPLLVLRRGSTGQKREHSAEILDDPELPVVSELRTHE